MNEVDNESARLSLPLMGKDWQKATVSWGNKIEDGGLGWLSSRVSASMYLIVQGTWRVAVGRFPLQDKNVLSNGRNSQIKLWERHGAY